MATAAAADATRRILRGERLVAFSAKDQCHSGIKIGQIKRQLEVLAVFSSKGDKLKRKDFL